MIKERILKYIDSKSITRYHFYKITGISNGFLDKDGAIGSDKCEKIISCFPDLDPEWLVTGKGEMIRTSLNGNKPTKVNRYLLKSDTSTVEEKIPLYNIEAAAGVVSIFESLHKQEPIAYIEIPNLPKCDGAVYVVGDSMYPLLKSGDIIAYKVLNDIANIFWGEMYLLSMLIDGDSFITVKYVQQSSKEGFVKLVSQNQHHQEKEVHLNCIKFAALIKASIRINCMG